MIIMMTLMTILMTPTMMMIKVNKEWSAIILGESGICSGSHSTFPFLGGKSFPEMMSFLSQTLRYTFSLRRRCRSYKCLEKVFLFSFAKKNHCMLQIILVEDGIWVNSVSDIERPILQTYQFLLCFCPQFEDGYCFSLSDIVRSNHI